MKKTMTVAVVCVFALMSCVSAHAVLDDNSVLKDSTNALAGAAAIGTGGDATARVVNSGNSSAGASADSLNVNISDAKSRAVSDQTQAQLQKQNTKQKTQQANQQGTIVGVDASDKTDVFAPVYVAPGLRPAKGMQETQLQSLFGGIGFSQTEEYATCAESIDLTFRAYAAGILTKDEAKDEYLLAKMQFEDATAPKRVLGFLGETRGQHAYNALGLFACDAWDFNIDSVWEFLFEAHEPTEDK